MSFSRRSFFVLGVAGSLACVLRNQSYAAEIQFQDVVKQSREFMGWEKSISLTSAQERVKKQALESIPAPCCSDNSAYTCCCTCNISRTIWGLSNYMIAKQNATPVQVQTKVKEWVGFINPEGFSGMSCYQGGCNRPFHKDGCGGMNATNLVLN